MSNEVNNGPADLQQVWHGFVGVMLCNKKILDVGSGRGYSKERLSANNNEVTTQDINRNLMDVVDIIKPIELLQEKAWDIVTSFDVIEHVYAPQEFLKSLARLAKEGVFVTTPNKMLHPKNWHYTAQEFVDICNGALQNGNKKYFARKKLSDCDSVYEIDLDYLLKNADIYSFGVLLGIG